MIKFMAWERSFEKRIQAIREKELRWQKRLSRPLTVLAGRTLC
jgi:hypothetical protein